MNGIKARMKSVTGTKQITKAMELVATSKLRRARERADRARPFLDISTRAIGAVAAHEEAKGSPFVTGQAAPTLYIIVAGDRGLAGGYNSNIFRLYAERSGGEGIVLPVGKKSVEHFVRRGIPILSDAFAEVSDCEVADTVRMARLVAEAFVGGRIGRVELIYTRFVSMISQLPTAVTLLPLSPTPDAAPTALAEEEDFDELLEALVPTYLCGALHASVCEAVAAECGARRSAMSAASKNAEAMLDELMLRFNRARQAVITQEITEIVSGSEAL